MNRFRWLCGALGLCLATVSCGGPEYSGDKRFPVTGTATFDGQSIDLGAISLVPTGGGRACGGVIQDGKIEIPEENGPTAGTYRVELSWLKLTGRKLRDAETGEMYDERKEALPPKYQKDSTLQAEVPSENNTYNFELTAN
ncbi:MAG: hypothetical protein AB7O38_17125 [Pirellulaceae bacterium]